MHFATSDVCKFFFWYGLSLDSVVVLFLSRPRTVSENAYVKCGSSRRDSIGRDDVGISIFFGDKVYKFRPKITIYNNLC